MGVGPVVGQAEADDLRLFRRIAAMDASAPIPNLPDAQPTWSDAGALASKWGLGQLATGPLSDRLGRKPLITGGMLLQAAALAGIALAGSFHGWAAGAILLGVGTAMVYPTLLAAVSDVAHPSWRASAVGVYRLWRDAGFAVGALLAGLVADLAGLEAAIWVIAGLTAASGLVVAVRMYETHRPTTFDVDPARTV